jgi:hypothetical protein
MNSPASAVTGRQAVTTTRDKCIRWLRKLAKTYRPLALVQESSKDSQHKDPSRALVAEQGNGKEIAENVLSSREQREFVLFIATNHAASKQLQVLSSA